MNFSSRHIRRSLGSGGGDASSVLSSGGRTQKSSGSSKLSHGATARDSGGSSGHCTHRSEPAPRIQVQKLMILEILYFENVRFYRFGFYRSFRIAGLIFEETAARPRNIPPRKIDRGKVVTLAVHRLLLLDNIARILKVATAKRITAQLVIRGIIYLPRKNLQSLMHCLL